jgi:hypothetical protein
MEEETYGLKEKDIVCFRMGINIETFCKIKVLAQRYSLLSYGHKYRDLL